jgi:hypothetical protein
LKAPTLGALLVSTLIWTSGNAGFSPTDEGYLAAQSYRIVRGQIPHVDFISPRPDLSAYLHVVDLLLPVPLLVAVRVVGATVVVAYSLVLVGLIRSRPPRCWGAVDVGLAAIAAALDLHLFPLMSWPTTDGLLFVAVGLATLASGDGSRRRVLEPLAFVLLGLAALTKQSFVLAPLVWVVTIGLRQDPDVPRVRRFVRSLHLLAISAVPSAIYAVAIAASGGWHPLLDQLTAGRLVAGGSLLRTPIPATIPLAFLGGVALDFRRRRVLGWLLLASEVGFVLATGSLDRFSAIPHLLWWQACGVLVASAWRRRHIEATAFVILAMGWMATLSWGYPTPALMSGCLVVLLVSWTPTDAGEPLPDEGRARAATAAFWLGAAVVVLAAIVVARQRTPYLDRTRAGRTFALSRVSPEFGDIHTNEVTGRLMSDVARCGAQFDVSRRIVLPDGAWAYPTLRWANPLRTDWPLDQDLTGEPNAMVDAAAQLRREGNFLVLWSPVSGGQLPMLHHLPDPAKEAPTGPFGYWRVTQFLAALGPPSGTCRSLYFWTEP